MILYELLNKITGEGYVGITHRPIKLRKREHLYPLRGDKHHNPRLQHAFNKYGEKSFKFIIRETFEDLGSLNQAEKEVLQREKDRLYNIAPGGNSGYLEMEARRKISDGSKIPLVAMNIKTGEIKEYSSGMETLKDGFDPRAIGGACKLSEYNSDRHRTYSRISHHGWVWMYKKDFNLNEMERRRQLAIRGKIRLERSIIGKNLKTREIIKFHSANEAGRNGFSGANIYAVCSGRARSHKGYVWLYSDVLNFENLIEEKYNNFIKNPPKTGVKIWQ